MECYDKTQTVVQDAPKETCSLEPHLFATVRVAVDAPVATVNAKDVFLATLRC